MPRHGSTRRTPTEWAIRTGLALLTLVVASISVAHSLAPAVVDGDPALAHALDPGNGRITAQLARSYYLENPDGRDGEIARLSSLALRHDPPAVQAAATLGYQAQLHGDTVLARHWLDYAQRLSRRDSLTQLWFIENAIAHRAIPEALHHYDIALRTTKTAPNLLFPILASAVSEPAVRASLVNVLVHRPPWSDLFLRFAADNADPRGIADLYRRLIAHGVAPPREAARIAIQRLVDETALDDAWALYTAIHPNADRRRSRDPVFTADSSAASLFDWVLVNDDSITTSIQRGPRGGAFNFAVPSGIGGVMLRQTQWLPTGQYRLEGHSNGLDQPTRALPYWTLSCTDGRPLGQVATTATAQGGRFAGTFVVPADCPVQILALTAHSSDDIAGVTGQIDRAELMPAGARP